MSPKILTRIWATIKLEDLTHNLAMPKIAAFHNKKQHAPTQKSPRIG
jgi:hypothetical protein